MTAATIPTLLNESNPGGGLTQKPGGHVETLKPLPAVAGKETGHISQSKSPLFGIGQKKTWKKQDIQNKEEVLVHGLADDAAVKDEGGMATDPVAECDTGAEKNGYYVCYNERGDNAEARCDFEADRNLIYYPMIYPKVYKRWLSNELSWENEAYWNNLIFNWIPVTAMAIYMVYNVSWKVTLANFVVVQLIQSIVFLSAHSQLHAHFLQGAQTNVVGYPYGYFHHYTDSRCYAYTVYRYNTLFPFMVAIMLFLIPCGMRPETLILWRMQADFDGQTHQWYHCNWKTFFNKGWDPITYASQHKSLRYFVQFLADIGVLDKHMHGEDHHKDRINNAHLTYNWVDVHYPFISKIEEAICDAFYAGYKNHLRKTRGTHYPVCLQDLFSVVDKKKPNMTKEQEHEILAEHYAVIERRYGVVSEFLFKDYPDFATIEKWNYTKWDVEDYRKESARWVFGRQLPVTAAFLFVVIQLYAISLYYMGLYDITFFSFDDSFSFYGYFSNLLGSDMSALEMVSTVCASFFSLETAMNVCKDARFIIFVLSVTVSYSGLEGQFCPYIDLHDMRGTDDNQEDRATIHFVENWPGKLWRKCPPGKAPLETKPSLQSEASTQSQKEPEKEVSPDPSPKITPDASPRSKKDM